jgi:putative PIN family toxin of toxin-antitoxin system
LVRSHPRSRSAARKVLEALLEGPHTVVLSSEIIAETIKVLRYPRLQKLHALTEAELYEYSQFLHDVSDIVVIAASYHAPLRDPNDLDVLQTAELGAADVLCSGDADFHAADIVLFCATLGIEVCDEVALLRRLRT